MANHPTISGRDLYYSARAFLVEKLEQQGLKEPEKTLNAHLKPEINPKITTFPDIMSRFLDSWKNAQSKANVIGNIDGVKSALFDFDHIKILDFFHIDCAGDYDELLNHIIKESKKEEPRRSVRSHWPQFTRGVISISEFLSIFTTPEEFNCWVDEFYRNPDTRGALPLVLAMEIHGFGYALACDFLKEIGYTKFAKPDVHLKEILVFCGISPRMANDYVVHKSILECAKDANVEPYEFDKVLWLIGSGKFYLEKDSAGNELRVGRSKSEFKSWLKGKDWAIID